MIPKQSQLIKLKVDYGVYENELYFDIEQLRELYPDLRFPPDKIKTVFINTVAKEGIKQQDIQELTEFDKNVIKLYNFKK
jgi:hypothetical protein